MYKCVIVAYYQHQKTKILSIHFVGMNAKWYLLCTALDRNEMQTNVCLINIKYLVHSLN